MAAIAYVIGGIIIIGAIGYLFSAFWRKPPPRGDWYESGYGMWGRDDRDRYDH